MRLFIVGTLRKERGEGVRKGLSPSWEGDGISLQMEEEFRNPGKCPYRALREKGVSIDPTAPFKMY